MYIWTVEYMDLEVTAHKTAETAFKEIKEYFMDFGSNRNYSKEEIDSAINEMQKDYKDGINFGINCNEFWANARLIKVIE